MAHRTVTTVTEYEYDPDGRVTKETVTTTEREDPPLPPNIGWPPKPNYPPGQWPWGSGFFAYADSEHTHSFNH